MLVSFVVVAYNAEKNRVSKDLKVTRVTKGILVNKGQKVTKVIRVIPEPQVKVSQFIKLMHQL